ncbi:MAG: hypothetical protein IKD73_10585 [Selenomonadaceae bacterium]|nr:hypothetical protein [Selenomonadaceae bacterium]
MCLSRKFYAYNKSPPRRQGAGAEFLSTKSVNNVGCASLVGIFENEEVSILDVAIDDWQRLNDLITAYIVGFIATWIIGFDDPPEI